MEKLFALILAVVVLLGVIGCSTTAPTTTVSAPIVHVNTTAPASTPNVSNALHWDTSNIPVNGLCQFRTFDTREGVKFLSPQSAIFVDPEDVSEIKYSQRAFDTLEKFEENFELVCVNGVITSITGYDYYHLPIFTDEVNSDSVRIDARHANAPDVPCMFADVHIRYNDVDYVLELVRFDPDIP